jgi:protein-L-isoaspartate(D-aspartate) O-methyltransferase
MAQMVGKSGKVIGIDHLQGLVDLSRENILKKDKYLLDDGRVKLLFGDGWDGCTDGRWSVEQFRTDRAIK